MSVEEGDARRTHDAVADARSGAPTEDERAPSSVAGSEPSPSGSEVVDRPHERGRRRRRSRLVFVLLGGAAAAFYLGNVGPREQHVHVVLGAGAADVAGVDLEYAGKDGAAVRGAHFVYPIGRAPRIVTHEPKLPDGEYRLRVEVDARGGRRETQRQVTLGGGSTQIDVSTLLVSERQPPSRPTPSWAPNDP